MSVHVYLCVRGGGGGGGGSVCIFILCLCPQGGENRGFEVLMQNSKAGLNASKELGEFIKER